MNDRYHAPVALFEQYEPDESILNLHEAAQTIIETHEYNLQPTAVAEKPQANEQLGLHKESVFFATASGKLVTAEVYTSNSESELSLDSLINRKKGSALIVTSDNQEDNGRGHYYLAQMNQVIDVNQSLKNNAIKGFNLAEDEEHPTITFNKSWGLLDETPAVKQVIVLGKTYNSDKRAELGETHNFGGNSPFGLLDVIANTVNKKPTAPTESVDKTADTLVAARAEVEASASSSSTYRASLYEDSVPKENPTIVISRVNRPAEVSAITQSASKPNSDLIGRNDKLTGHGPASKDKFYTKEAVLGLTNDAADLAIDFAKNIRNVDLEMLSSSIQGGLKKGFDLVKSLNNKVNDLSINVMSRLSTAGVTKAEDANRSKTPEEIQREKYMKRIKKVGGFAVGITVLYVAGKHTGSAHAAGGIHQHLTHANATASHSSHLLSEHFSKLSKSSPSFINDKIKHYKDYISAKNPMNDIRLGHGGTVWQIAKEQLAKSGQKNPSNRQVFLKTAKILKINHISWTNAKHLSAGSEIKLK
jgi:hypothetical protein